MPFQEDRVDVHVGDGMAAFGVYDGHRGDFVSERLREVLLQVCEGG
jgi:hypothetical protein